MILRAFIMLMAIALPLGAQEPAEPAETIVAGLSREDVDITTSFDGSDIIIYGAIKREQPIPTSGLDVIVTVEGPARSVTVRHKERRFGIWMNTGKVSVAAAPNFYVVATTGPLDQILDRDQDNRFRISVPLAIRAFAGVSDVDDVVPYTEALVRLRESHDQYRLDNGAVVLAEQTLFRADVRLPANLTEGLYATRIFLLREGKVIDTFRAPIEVRKVGLERWLYRLAWEQPFVYGLMSLALAMAAGWAASAAFRALQRR
ncbi:TIGR02186 family protein [Paracoccus sp. MBLB3053]|uniref:TIGR02186 family protein n=1 Tax=Paracoccus aurantius TaxID=3073814 RepID=A0ABU2HNU4_9RHOB|nr:TIGR02186 family protein [Paracoccus sp. MBLB3053]MDS9466703.1 TIGR02186 family protein [Paracoccus sp. MBLB3053]